jgi:hypothetical protein
MLGTSIMIEEDEKYIQILMGKPEWTMHLWDMRIILK